MIFEGALKKYIFSSASATNTPLLSYESYMTMVSIDYRWIGLLNSDLFVYKHSNHNKKDNVHIKMTYITQLRRISVTTSVKQSGILYPKHRTRGLLFQQCQFPQSARGIRNQSLNERRRSGKETCPAQTQTLSWGKCMDFRKEADRNCPVS